MTDVLERYRAMLETPSVLAVDPSALLRDLAAEIERFRGPALSLVGVEQTDSSVLQNDLHDMLITLGLPDGARPQSPHEVFRGCIEAIKQMRAQSLVGVDRAAPPLRAREEMARAHVFVRGKLNEGPWQTDYEAERCAEEIVAGVLGRTAGQEWRDISSAPLGDDDFYLVCCNDPADDRSPFVVRGSIFASARKHPVQHHLSLAYLTHWMPLPAKPLPAPPVAEKQTS